MELKRAFIRMINKCNTRAILIQLPNDVIDVCLCSAKNKACRVACTFPRHYVCNYWRVKTSLQTNNKHECVINTVIGTYNIIAKSDLALIIEHEQVEEIISFGII
jgi:hypothetical protein